MVADVLHALITTTLAISVAIVVVRLARKPIQYIAGVQVAYGLWILVPMMATAILLPLPSIIEPVHVTLPTQLTSSATANISELVSYRTILIRLLVAVWIIGACGLCFLVGIRQRSFLRSLGPLSREKENLYRAPGAAVPMVIGVWRPKVILPTDFESRYSSLECELILAHERAHAARRDMAANVVASLVVCLYWFNPLMYLALAWLRMDQELACDATVLATRADARGKYANALLKSQIADKSLAARYPIGCYWHSVHPLKERIIMLKRPRPSSSRRVAGVALILAITLVATYAALAGQPAQDSRLVLVNLKVTVSNSQTNQVKALATQYLVNSGEVIKDANNQPLDFSCTPYLSDEPGHSTDWSDQKRRGIPLPAAGQILLDCAIWRAGEVVNRPAVMFRDGKTGTIETLEHGGAHRFRLEVTATTSSEAIALARAQAGTR
jgi:beta-lactamase regulating signal transducer with metallopeptidase domain